MSEENQTTDPEKVEAEKLPSVRAFEDEFTKGFLQSINETEEGFYPFLSETGDYEMNFPSDGIIDERGYYLRDGTEKFSFGFALNDFNTRVNIEYLQFMEQDSMNSRLKAMKQNSDTPLQFQETKSDNRIMQKAYYEDNLGYSGYVAIIQNAASNGAIELSTVSECKKKVKNCDQVQEEAKATISNWLESIKFSSKTGSE